MSIVLDAINASIAELVPVQPAPTGDLGFGSDLSCTDDLTPDFAEIGGDSPRIVAESNYRRLTTPGGSLDFDEGAGDYGHDVTQYLNSATTPADIVAIQGQVKGELQKDDRNLTVDVAMTLTDSNGSFDLQVSGTTAQGPFSLTLAVTDAGALLKEMNA